MAEQTGMNVYVPNIIYGREKYEYHAITCGVFRNKKDALHALIRKLVYMEWICPEYIFEESHTYGGVELKAGDNEHNIQVLCNHANTMEDVEDICNKFNDSFYGDGWDIEVKEFQLQ